MNFEQRHAAEAAAWEAIHELASGAETWLGPWRYTYSVDDHGTRLEGELPELDWVPVRVRDVLRQQQDAARSAGLPGLLSVEVRHLDGGEPRDARYLIGVVACDQMWLFALCSELIKLDAELGRTGCADEQRMEQLSRRVDEWLFHTAPSHRWTLPRRRNSFLFSKGRIPGGARCPVRFVAW
jgi:hypothetical protein